MAPPKRISPQKRRKNTANWLRITYASSQTSSWIFARATDRRLQPGYRDGIPCRRLGMAARDEVRWERALPGVRASLDRPVPSMGDLGFRCLQVAIRSKVFGEEDGIYPAQPGQYQQAQTLCGEGVAVGDQRRKTVGGERGPFGGYVDRKVVFVISAVVPTGVAYCVALTVLWMEEGGKVGVVCFVRSSQGVTRTSGGGLWRCHSVCGEG
jgi:hypothetical protein